MKAVPTPAHLPADGDCYENAILYLIANKREGLVLVHGRPTLQCPPFCQFGHAWVEDGAWCIDAASGELIPKLVYYGVGRIDPALCFSYTREFALKMALKFKHYGPWEGVDAAPVVEDTGE